MREIGPFEEHRLPSGVTVYYRDSDHSYWSGIKGTEEKGYTGTGRLTGVSTVASPLDFRPDNLMKWAAHLQGHGVSVLAAEGLSLEDVEDMRGALQWLATGDSVWNALEEARLLFSDRRDDAASRGTNVHKHGLHAMAEGRPVPDLSLLTAEEQGFVRGIMAFWHECEPEVLQAEQVIAIPEHGVAGRFDLRARLHGTYRGERLGGAVCMVDAKTSGFVPAKHHGQLAGYDLGAITSGFGPSDRQMILQVDAFGRYELIDGQGTHDDFLDALRVYRASGRINRECGKARRAAAAPQAVAA